MLQGREREQERIDSLLVAAAKGTGGALALVGEAGAGKSALLEYARERAGKFKTTAVIGIERESDLGYAGLHQLLRPWLGLAERLPAPSAQAVRVALGLEHGREPDRFLVSAAVLEMLAEAAADAPVLVIVDDLQWLDRPSADALVFAARRIAADPVALIAAVREQDGEPLDHGLPTVRLCGLELDAVAALMADLTGRELPETVVAALAEQTRGNPLALVELSGLLSDEQLAGRVALPDPMPVASTLGDGFAARIGALPASCRTALLVAAAAGGADLVSVQGAAARLGVEVDDLAAAERAGLVAIRDGIVTFRHPLVRAASYHSATFQERRAVHLALAATLSERDEPERRAWHLASAAIGTDAEAADALEQVARRAQERGAHASAAAEFERAAELSDDADDRLRRRLAGVAAARRAGLLERALAGLDAVESQGADRVELTQVAVARAEIDAEQGRHDHALTRFRAAAASYASIDVEQARRFLYEAMIVAGEAGRWGEIEAIADQAASLDMHGDHVLARFLSALSRSVSGLDDGDGETFASFAAHDHPELDEELSASVRSIAYLDPRHDRGAPDAVAFAQWAADRARISPDPSLWLPAWLALRADSEYLAGSWSAARADAVEATELAHEMRLRDAEANAVAVLAMLAAAQGRFDELYELTGPSWPDAGGAAATIRSVRRVWALGLAALGSARPEDALALLDVSDRGEPWISPWLTADLVEAAVQAGRPAAAESTLAALEAWAERAGPPIARALAARSRGLLSDGDASVVHLQAALSYHDRAFQPFERARTELALGGTLRRARRRSEARAPLRAALSGFEHLGAVPWADRARSELRASGETFQRRDPAAVEVLTPQEFQVARFVAAGGTNRDVAAQLFLSHRTVAYHLHNVYRKLGVTSRTELARVEFEQGLEMSPR